MTAETTPTRVDTVTVVGLGYIGLPTAAILANRGIDVHGADLDARVVEAVNAGEVPFVEPDLAGFVASAVTAGRLSASHEVRRSQAYIIAVPTPFHDDLTPDLTFVRSAADAIAPVLVPGALVVLESTSPPGTTLRLGEWIAETRPDLVGDDGALLVHLAHCPERVLPGRIMAELTSNDRIIGGVTPEAARAARSVYEVFCEGEIFLTDATTAELTKLVENSYRDVNIAFANELSLIADQVGVNVWELIRLANRHPRVNILEPGPGVGGHCIAVDPWFVVSAAPDVSRLIRTARAVNDSKPSWVADRVVAATPRDDAVIAALGLAFKADVDDIRQSPARAIVAEIAERLPHATVLVVEPHVRELPPELAERPNVRLESLDAALGAADCVALLVDHRSFRRAPAPLGVPLVDTRGLWER
ncbi:nucleotide sugar dehydrogenase [Beutenbergia cavernae DSM 12333]|uniref:Nucleotide sugar dehydrogenase n=1 Tax=Beutenbergia cavernae (strain ATCC BAA-8 / DSM 12333 / CCUG 43141 / JCM 11478 / NBRC 16432 / NCIMB 13614 / HKI 0122) TaxID=471853 RepID=C5C151_BEUC1|nr:UDP-N-acetyl-D-mannosamine dehydrogenase [Beutenbergia cavernae]ACQ79455.1 nucleotide sugar dehydrogenase [Beutenbergia cavernae DSM 12333]